MIQNNVSWRDLSDTAIAQRLAAYIKNQRLQANQTQKELATSAGVGLRTLIGIETGGINMTVLTLIQLLRALDSLNVLEGFEIKEQISSAGEVYNQINKPDNNAGRISFNVDDITVEEFKVEALTEEKIKNLIAVSL